MIIVTLINGKEIEINNTENLPATTIKQVMADKTFIRLYNCIFKVDDISAIEVKGDD